MTPYLIFSLRRPIIFDKNMLQQLLIKVSRFRLFFEIFIYVCQHRAFLILRSIISILELANSRLRFFNFSFTIFFQLQLYSEEDVKRDAVDAFSELKKVSYSNPSVLCKFKSS